MTWLELDELRKAGTEPERVARELRALMRFPPMTPEERTARMRLMGWLGQFFRYDNDGHKKRPVEGFMAHLPCKGPKE